MNDLRQKLKEAINTTLVVQNNQSIDRCIDKIELAIVNIYGYFPDNKRVFHDNQKLTLDQWYNIYSENELIPSKSYTREELEKLYKEYLKENNE